MKEVKNLLSPLNILVKQKAFRIGQTRDLLSHKAISPLIISLDPAKVKE